MDVSLDEVLGLVYVTAWSISMYVPLIANFKFRSTNALSIDFVILNTTGYFYLIYSVVLQVYYWQTETTSLLERPQVTKFDLWYCLHGFIINLVLLSQIYYGKLLWNFEKNTKRRMKSIYQKVLIISVSVFIFLTARFYYFQSTNFNNWSNELLLNYCNCLFLLKMSMSLIKYLPQVKYNFERKSLKGFAVQGVILDVVGGMASLAQLIIQLNKSHGLNMHTVATNFGKIGVALVTLFFNAIFISQWLIYEKITSKGTLV
ncbi:hypothetical protein KAFR_0F04320 [Kazachstania africana CBS 2517]|uniref:Uncharacterized protein n=1 Tax=Kazachstania africana (strain ATCC 22294 / BCRC 22015 / CBS 2517 / CECT 1963 / NBRC 1671 / NRRL Y-8276) TaxID=1071382 RepID=H2AXC7_KAZAF|nr:hypothetical protein KAFR_0F04320 [Kazachstania africana CBS 2517]CCF59027.1 hypothetical protein KAFR_0F04320 [Kazachstania africana CBS 2517]